MLPRLLIVLALILPSWGGATTVVPLPPAPVAALPPSPVTILISIDGFRPDYLDRRVTPRLNALAVGGVRASMKTSFPSLTFPNHQTLVTGLRPDRHGMVGNTMEDARKPGVAFTLANNDPFWWTESEPIWVTAERQGLRTATMFWPGSNVDYGIRPRDWWPYQKDVSERQRVDAVVDWLRRPQAIRPQFITLYFDTVDTTGHKYGPDAAEVTSAVARVDTLIGRLVDEAAALGQPINLVVVSDHGMTTTAPDRVIELYELARAKDFRMVTSGPYAGVEPQPGRSQAIEAALLKANPHMNCYRKVQLPARLHFGANARVPSIVCIAQDGWIILGAPPEKDRPYYATGAHGYDNDDPLMDALFIAHGPAFAGGVVLPRFDNVDVYPLVARLIGIRPNASDGDATVFAPALIHASR